MGAGCGKRGASAEQRARSSLLRRSESYASSVVAALATLARAPFASLRHPSWVSLLPLGCALAGAAARSAFAQAVVEGTVALSRAVAPPVSKARYPLAASYTVGPPDPPAAVVYL